MSDPQTDLILSLRDTVRAQIDIVEVLRIEVVRLHRRVVDLEAVVGKLNNPLSDVIDRWPGNSTLSG